jgi:hypothetical protein
VLYQLSYAPGLRPKCTGACFDHSRRASLPAVQAPSQRRALGVLFFFLGGMFAGVAFAAAASAEGAAGWIVAIAAGAIGLWLLSLALRALRAH